MTNFYKVIENGYVIGIGTNGSDTADAITDAEYNQLLTIIRNAPTAPGGYVYMLNANTLEWDLIELPDPDPEAEISDYEQELSDLGVRFE